MPDLPDYPQSNVEAYLAALIGQGVDLPEKPLSRVEKYLAYLVVNGFGGSNSYTKEEIDELLEEIGTTVSQCAKLIRRTLTIPITGWVYDSVTGSENYPYYVDVASAGVTESMVPIAIFPPEYESEAVLCGFSSSCQTSTDSTRFFSAEVPTSAMVVNVSYIGT